MGYVPPAPPIVILPEGFSLDARSGVLTTPANLTRAAFEDFVERWHGNVAMPRGGLPRTLAEYRRAVYQPTQTDWVPRLAGLILIVLIIALVLTA